MNCTLLKTILASGASAALTLCALLPAAAHGHEHVRAAAAPQARAAGHAAPARHYAAPAAPRYAHYAAPARRHYAAPAAPRYAHYAAPARRHYAAPAAPRYAHYAAPARRHYAAPAAPRYAHYSAPARRHYAAPRHYANYARSVRSAPFEQRIRVAPRERFERAQSAPFVQYVRVPRYRTRFAAERRIVRSPLMRTMYAARPRQAVVYHPAYLTGRVVSVRPELVVLQPVSGPAIPIECNCLATPLRSGSFVTVPAYYDNAGYYRYAYAPQYYPHTATVPALVQYVASYFAPYSGSAPYYGNTSYYGNTPYYGNAPYYDNSYDSYGYTPSPYDNCLNSDEDEDSDGYCAAQPSPYYGSYGTQIAPQQVQGIVVAKTGDMLMVLGANGLRPIFVNAAPAFQNGFAVNGPVAVGQLVDAFGYYNGDTFVATALE